MFSMHYNLTVKITGGPTVSSQEVTMSGSPLSQDHTRSGKAVLNKSFIMLHNELVPLSVKIDSNSKVQSVSRTKRTVFDLDNGSKNKISEM